jgi:hypothetical protein
VLDSFGGRGRAQQAAELDGGLQELEIFRRRAHRVDQALVDLHDVDGQAEQPLEGRTAGAEVVESDPDAEVAEGGEHRVGVVDIAGERTLGELHHENAGGQRRRAERGGHGVEEPGIGELSRRQVDAHVEAAVDHAGGSPSTHLLGRLADRPATHGDDETGGLEQVDELAGPQEPPHGVAPAEQRLRPCRDAAASRVDNGLVVQLELVARKCLRELFERRWGSADLHGRAVFRDRGGLHVDSPPSGARDVPLLACSWRGVSADFRPR